jgi:SAM-dependent methyltransferase
MMTATDSKERFSNRVAEYIRYRPGYPREVLDLLREECGLTRESVVADIGSGTGILTQLFLENGNLVHGVEPNAEMRAAGEDLLRAYPRFRSVAGSAEATTLLPASVDFVVVGTAFHWFEPTGARAEFLRVLRPGGWVVVVANARLGEATPLQAEYERLVRKYGIDYWKVSETYLKYREMEDFFCSVSYAEKSFPNEQVFDFDGLRGRLLSASYSPPMGHPNYEPMLVELKRIFDAHQQGGRVRFEYRTHVQYGQLEARGAE